MRAALITLAVVAVAGCGAGTPSDTAAPAPAPTTAAPTASAPTTPDATTPEPGLTYGTPEPVDGPPVLELTYAGGEVSGDTGVVDVVAGEPVLLLVTSDIMEEVHVHGAEEYLQLAPGVTSELEFTAPPPGRYEVELHDSGTVLAFLQST